MIVLRYRRVRDDCITTRRDKQNSACVSLRCSRNEAVGPAAALSAVGFGVHEAQHLGTEANNGNEELKHLDCRVAVKKHR
jgi:hypothetical protein